MSGRKMRVTSPCPACHQPTIEYSAIQLDVPYFGEILQTVFICSECGFRHADVLIGTVREPKRHTFRTRSERDLHVRVVRSTSGTVRIPELGVLIEPGPASEAYVSNIEGILDRVQAIVQQLERDADDEATRAACRERLALLGRAREGTAPITVILEDPYGNSGIVHDDTKVESIPLEEAEQLPRGEFTFDLAAEKPGGKEAGGNGDRKRKKPGPPG